MPVFKKDQEPKGNSVVPAAFSAPRPLTAAAVQIKLDDKSEADRFKARRGTSTFQWQQEAWEYYDAIGEIKYAFNLVGNVISRVRLYVASVDDPSASPTDISDSDTVDQQLADAAKRALSRLSSAYGGQAGLLRDAALNLSVTGEALDVDTPIPTPNGMVRMGDLSTGDFVFGGDGSPAQIIEALPIRNARPVYEVTLDSGAKIVADEDHLWEVYPVAKRLWSKQSGKTLEPQVLTTKEMSQHVKHYGRSNYAIKRAITAQTFHGELPLDPYILGYWLGDGWSSQGAITAHPDDQPYIKSELLRAGFESKTRNAGGGYQVGVYGLKVILRDMSVLNNKHIPEEYFLASVEDRLSLLQGLVDSDGHVYGDGQVEFCNKNPHILNAFVRLAGSLGLKPGKITPRIDGTFRINVRSAGLQIARLPRKAARLGSRTERDTWDYVRAIVPFGVRDVRCIAVESPGNTFLATDRHVRTHNCFLVQRPEQIGHGLPETWDIRSTDEISITDRGKYVITPRQGTGTSAYQVELPKGSFVGRIWRAHPRWSDEPDSSLKGLLDLCSELLLLNRTFRSTARSRLNAGALYLPDGLSLSATAETDYQFDDEIDITVQTHEEEEDTFEEQLVDAMTTPISDEASASAVVPLIIRGPAELGDKIKQFKFERSFDPALAERADRVLDRILQGLDVPKDIVTGLSNVRYSNALQIDESLYKAHIEPLLLLISDALTAVYLRPYLRSLGYDEAEISRLVIWYDPSAISTRNDRAADADAGFDKMAISYDAWRSAHGFSESDAPSADEIAIRMMSERGVITPELTEAMLSALAPNVMQKAREAGQAQSIAPIPADVQQALQGAQPAAEGAEPTAAEPNEEQAPQGLAEPV